MSPGDAGQAPGAGTPAGMPGGSAAGGTGGGAPELVTVGKVGRPHGVRGAFFVDGASEDPRRFAVGVRLLIGGVPVQVTESKHGAGQRRVLSVDGAAPRGALIQVPLADLPEPAEDEFYVFQLVGLAVEEEGGRALGGVRDVLPGSANDNLELDSGLLLPLVEDCVLDVDLAAGRILVAKGFVPDE